MRPSVQRLRSAAVACLASAAVACAVAPVTDAAASTPASVSVQVTSASPAAGVPVSMTVSGSDPGGQRLFAYVVGTGEGQQCAATPAAQGTASDTVATLSAPSGDAVATGAFSTSYSATIEVPGAYAVCAYLASSASASSATAGSSALRVGAPAASIAVKAAAKVTEGVAGSVKVTGNSAVPGHVYVDVATDNRQCQLTPAAEAAPSFGVTQLTPAAGAAVSTGSFTMGLSFTPPSAGTFTVCAYLAYYPEGTPWAQASADSSYAGIGTLPPARPGANCTGTAADRTPLTVIDDCRGREGVGPVTLPSNWGRLSTAQQIFVLTDLERVNRGASPILGLTSQLDQQAEIGARRKEDPPGVDGDWAGGFDSVMAAEIGWVYDDGYGSRNITCKARDAAGCWDHRQSLLSTNAVNLSAGAAYDAQTQSYTLALGGYSSDSTYIFSWAQELTSFRHAPTLEPLAAPVLRHATAATADGREVVNLTGSSLLNATAVAFGRQRAQRFGCGSEGHCQVTVPPGVSGTVAVTVRTPAGSSPAIRVRLAPAAGDDVTASARPGIRASTSGRPESS